MSRHTPYPWQVEYLSWKHIRVVAGQKTDICTMAMWADDEHRPELLANAALIASAPFMFKALEKIKKDASVPMSVRNIAEEAIDMAINGESTEATVQD